MSLIVDGVLVAISLCRKKLLLVDLVMVWINIVVFLKLRNERKLNQLHTGALNLLDALDAYASYGSLKKQHLDLQKHVETAANAPSVLTASKGTLEDLCPLGPPVNITNSPIKQSWYNAQYSFSTGSFARPIINPFLQSRSRRTGDSPGRPSQLVAKKSKIFSLA